MLASADGGLGSLLKAITDIAEMLIPIVASLALLYFFWGVAEYVRGVGASGKEEGRSKMFWGAIGLFVMMSIWGLVNFISSDFLGIKPTSSGGSYSSSYNNPRLNQNTPVPPCYDTRTGKTVVRNPNGSVTYTIGNKDLDPCKTDATNQIINLTAFTINKTWSATKWTASKIKNGAVGTFEWVFGSNNKTQDTQTQNPPAENTNPADDGTDNGMLESYRIDGTDDVDDSNVDVATDEPLEDEGDTTYPTDGPDENWMGPND